MNNIVNDDNSKRRDRHDIIAEILRTAKEGKIKTHIMYKAKLSYAQISEYIPTLVEGGFLENTMIRHRRYQKRVFRTTPKGLKFLDNFETINKLWSDLTNSL
jgi:predicted transcriptional regulator